MIIDSHAHIFSKDTGASLLSDLYLRANIKHFTDGSPQSLVQSMKISGIQTSVVSRIVVSPDRVVPVNQWLLKHRQDHILPLAAVHFDMPDLQAYIGTLKGIGFAGIKLHLDYQGIYADDKKMYPVYEAAQFHQLPVLFHAGLDNGLPPPVRAMPWHLLSIHQQFPELIMIAAHMGGEDNYEETKSYLLGKNIYLDTSFVLRLMEKQTLKYFFEHHSIDRILFGSDSPFTDQKTEIDFLLALDFLSDDQKEKVAGLNAARLLNLSI